MPQTCAILVLMRLDFLSALPIFAGVAINSAVRQALSLLERE